MNKPAALFIVLGLLAAPVFGAEDPNGHPLALTVLNGSGDGEYYEGEEVEISADTPGGYQFLMWIKTEGKGSHIAEFSPATTFTMGKTNATITAVFAKIEAWFPPGPEGEYKGLLLPEAQSSSRFEHKVRVTINRGEGTDEVTAEEVWGYLTVQLGWFPTPECEGIWHSNELVTYWTQQQGGQSIGKDQLVDKNLFLAGGDVYQTSVWYEGNWTLAQLAAKLGGDGQPVLPKASAGFKLKVNWKDFSQVKSTTSGMLATVEIERDEDAPDGNWQAITGQLAKGLPGQKMNLKVKTSNLPQGTTLSDYEWTVPDKTFKDYAADASSATLTPMSPNDFKTMEINFYWANAGAKNVKVNFKANGHTTEFATKIDVEKPTVTFTSQLGATALNSAQTEIGLFGSGGSGVGILFTGEVTISGQWSPGEWQWVQLVTPARSIIDKNGNEMHWSQNGQTVLDTYYPKPYGPYGTGDTFQASDRPSNGLEVLSKITVGNESFTTYLMFRPAGTDSRYVSLQSMNWSWGGVANRTNGSWTLSSPTQSAGSSVETSTHPTWTDNVANGSFQ